MFGPNSKESFCSDLIVKIPSAPDLMVKSPFVLDPTAKNPSEAQAKVVNVVDKTNNIDNKLIVTIIVVIMVALIVTVSAITLLTPYTCLSRPWS